MANAQAMKSANYLHLQAEQLLEACQKFIKENKINIKQLLRKQYNQILYEIYLFPLNR